MMRILTIAAALTGVALAADVVPTCGHRHAEVVVQGPWEDCGDHGPRWHGDCRAPSACFNLDSGGHRCTKECAQDADCAALGAGFTCSGTGVPYASTSSSPKRSLCARPDGPAK